MHTRTVLSSRKITGYQQRGDVDPSPTPPARCPRGIKGVFGPVGATLVVAQPIPIIQTSWQSWFKNPPPWCPRGELKGVLDHLSVSPAVRGKCPKGKGALSHVGATQPIPHHSNIMAIMVQNPHPRCPRATDSCDERFFADARNDRMRSAYRRLHPPPQTRICYLVQSRRDHE